MSRFQARLDRLTHLRASLDGQLVHLVHMPGRGPDPMPLLLTHGWPGSFCEYLDLLPLLTDPQAHGGDPGDAFTVVVPSLPGFGFSAPPPPGGLTHSAVAALWHRLMADGLGYRRYAATAATSEPGSQPGWPGSRRCRGGHPPSYSGAARPARAVDAGNRCTSPRPRAGPPKKAATLTSRPPSPRPWVPADDSPACLAAWIGEKIVAWSSTTSDGQAAFSRDLRLGSLTLYWATGTITSSMQPYWAYRHTPGSAPPRPAV